MRKFNVTVNGTPYQVEIEEVQAFAAPVVQAPAASVAPAAPVAPQASSAPAPAAPAAPKAAPAGGTELTAPMPGTVVKIIAKDGAVVKKGDVVLVLESMKMENDIVSPADGTVTVTTAAGTNVNAGDVLAVIA